MRFIWTDSQPGKWHMGSFSIIFHNLGIVPTSSGGRLAWYLQYFRPGRPNFVNISFLSRSKKMRAEKLYRFVVVLCRYQCFSVPLWPNEISEFGVISIDFVQCSFCSWFFSFPKCRRFFPVYRMNRIRSDGVR